MKRIKIFPYEHCDVKDIRIMFDIFRKQNINFMEILFTKWSYINPLYEQEITNLLDHREQIARFNFNQALRCMVGMSLEKMHALEHPYPNCVDEIEKYGYSRKQLSHIVRVNDFIKQYVAGIPYEKCLIPDIPEFILQLKTEPVPLAEARRIAQKYDSETYQIKEDRSFPDDKIDETVITLLDSTKCKIIRKKFKRELEEDFDDI